MELYIDRSVAVPSLKWVKVAITLVVVSLFLFPFELMALPGINTKMMLAVVGLALYTLLNASSRTGRLSLDMTILSTLAFLMSLMAWVSMVYNNTDDRAFASYLFSMWTWIGAAYLAVMSIRWTHGHASLRLVALYLASVCAAQCLLALWIFNDEALKTLVDSIVSQDQEFLTRIHRLYGIGAWLDPTGARFAGVLTIITVVLTTSKIRLTNGEISLLIFSFITIAIVGNIIARTTTVGLIISLAYVVIIALIPALRRVSSPGRFSKPLLLALLIIVPATVGLYLSNRESEKLIRYGFEGFFSLVEKGTWDVESNNDLLRTYQNEEKVPTETKTFLIGDGYFARPQLNPYYMGRSYDYYKGTDIGYFRYIFYFGAPGLLLYLGLLYYAMRIGWRRFPNERAMFLLLFLASLVIFFKVSTEIFMLTAILIMVDADENSLDYYPDEDTLLHRGNV
ncbi:MAG: hypothetical protein LIO90_08395 [Bacteroidales bacterium]|nr:hypothetical protein [Bacteroidales bacterium]